MGGTRLGTSSDLGNGISSVLERSGEGSTPLEGSSSQLRSAAKSATAFGALGTDVAKLICPLRADPGGGDLTILLMPLSSSDGITLDMGLSPKTAWKYLLASTTAPRCWWVEGENITPVLKKLHWLPVCF